jgi:hypothetical protein
MILKMDSLALGSTMGDRNRAILNGASTPDSRNYLWGVMRRVFTWQMKMTRPLEETKFILARVHEQICLGNKRWARATFRNSPPGIWVGFSGSYLLIIDQELTEEQLVKFFTDLGIEVVVLESFFGSKIYQFFIK